MSTVAHLKFPATRWGAERRLEFIDFRLLWDGTINRGELVDFFGISIQQASADLAHYAEIAPGNFSYDKSAKTYRVTKDFKPFLARSDAQCFLSQLADLATGAATPASLFLGWRPPCDVVRYPTRPVQTQTLLHLIWAIRDHEDLRIVYQSMRTPAPTERWIAPHALASDGSRWHMRAWCHDHQDFRDFVLSRVQRVVDRRSSAVDPSADTEWLTNIDIVIRPRAELSEGQQSAIEADFGMQRGRLTLTCRRALAFYVLRQLQLHRPADRTPVAEQPLELENPAALSMLLAQAKKASATATSVFKSNMES